MVPSIRGEGRRMVGWHSDYGISSQGTSCFRTNDQIPASALKVKCHPIQLGKVGLQVSSLLNYSSKLDSEDK